MIITTRYRDIPIEKVRECFPEASPKQWLKRRGKPVEIVAPHNNHTRDPCVLCRQEPHYNVAHSIFVVCPHIAEIGD